MRKAFSNDDLSKTPFVPTRKKRRRVKSLQMADSSVTSLLTENVEDGVNVLQPEYSYLESTAGDGKQSQVRILEYNKKQAQQANSCVLCFTVTHSATCIHTLSLLHSFLPSILSFFPSFLPFFLPSSIPPSLPSFLCLSFPPRLCNMYQYNIKTILI